jgi:ethanolamine transporter EutH
MLLPRPSVGAIWFSAPIALGIIFAAITRHWAALVVLAGCMLVPFLSLALYKADRRRHS